ncbi:hypothetical protein GCM10023084_38480 [Streptomyces lacrimifluminis]|uniref:Integral membrane protein n=1 Tax=Streptomyces lacrimifluminis TaxID=1500077 RepID=A0A917L0Q8_9ACTN|nr:hypothetical protein [Streptomyces lacrimifluminis]GGJ39425.1 hypothetical protein GCM10012282_40100 [Streptomyces lacrimifluminis]
MSAIQFAALAARSAEPPLMLRRFLALDALVTGANSVAYLVASGPLARFLGVDSGLLFELGLFLAVYAGAVGWLASRQRPAVLPVRVVIEANLAWAAVSCVALVLWLTPSTAGTVWAVLQAAVVAGFAALQYVSLRAGR